MKPPLTPTDVLDPAGRMTPQVEVTLAVTGSGGTALSVSIRVAASGAPGPARPPALLVHGFGSDGRSNWMVTGWQRALHRAGISSVAVDLRGHGRSAKPHDSSAYSLPIMVGDLCSVLGAVPQVLGPTPAVDVIGYSMGSRLAGDLVAAHVRSPAYPERIAWPPGLPGIRRAVLGGYDGRPLMAGSDSSQLSDFRDALAGRSGEPGPGRRMAAVALAGASNDLRALTALAEGMSAHPTRLPAAAVAVPTLAVAGDRDEMTDDTRRWASELPQGRYLTLPGRDHVSAVTSGLFRAAAVEFLCGETRVG